MGVKEGIGYGSATPPYENSSRFWDVPNQGEYDMFDLDSAGTQRAAQLERNQDRPLVGSLFVLRNMSLNSR
jgi:hypothetical protein